MSQIRDQIIRRVLIVEQGYVNDPADSGGETNFGITITVARRFGYMGKMENMPEQMAIQIYAKRYWNKMYLDQISTISVELAEELMDTAVNMGTKRATRFLQRSLNVLNNKGEYYGDVAVDGIMGPGTLTAFSCYNLKRGPAGMRVLFKILNCLQGAFYVKLAERREKDERFVYGWFKNRVA
jgi:lysozyme family protein